MMLQKVHCMHFNHSARALSWCQWDGGRGRAAAPGGTLQGAAFEGRKFVILVFTLQCVRVSLYLFFIYSVH